MTIEIIADRHPLIIKTMTWQDETSTAAFAHALAQKPRIGNALIELQGDLGAGKTTFARNGAKGSVANEGKIETDLGGYVADKVIGYQRSILVGAIFMARYSMSPCGWLLFVVSIRTASR